MIVIKKDVAEEISKSLKGNKNIFTHGDFDEFKISDEELKEHEKEIEEDSEILDKTGKIKREVDPSVYKVSLTKAIDNDTLNLINTETTRKLSIRKNTLSSRIQKSNEYSTKRIKEEFQKDFTVNISDITENNKAKKIDQLEKALTCAYEGTPFRINHIPADNSKNYGDVTLRIHDFDKSKIEKAVRNLSFSLDVPLKAAKGEVFYYQSQEELTNLIVADLTAKTRALYDFVIYFLGLPERTIMSKAYLKYKGKILYSPETGEPINKRDWKKFVKALEAFLNRNHKGFGRRIVLNSRKLGKLLENMSKYQTKENLRKLPLTEIKEPGKKTPIKWTETDPEKIEKIFNDAAEKWQQLRISVAEMSAAQKIQKVDDVMRNDIQQIIIDGIKNKKSKGQVSQDLFDKCASLNRDIQRIADTEIQNNVNNAFIAETVRENEGSGKKTYFIRREVLDGNTCPKCRKLNGKIAVWSNSPLENEKIKDPYAEYAIWEGKDDWNYEAPNGTIHCYCRGCWDSFDPDYDELPKKDDVKKSLTWSGYKLQGRKKFAGFNISIENKKDSYREGTDSNGHKWRVKMYHDYGYIRGTVGTDGDHLDCVSPETKILMGNYTEKRADEIKIGDELIGISLGTKQHSPRKQIITKVTNVSKGIQDMLNIKLSNGVVLKTTLGHLHYKFVGKTKDKVWKRADELKIGDKLVMVFNHKDLVESEDYKKGYLYGAYLGDGSVNYDNSRQLFCDIKKGEKYSNVIYRVKQYWNDLNICTPEVKIVLPRQTNSLMKDGRKIISTMKMAELIIRGKYQVESTKEILTHTYKDNYEWCRGFISGIYDTDGCLNCRYEFQITQTKNQKEFMSLVIKCLETLGYKAVQRDNTVKINTDYMADNITMELTQILKPAVDKKRCFLGQGYRFEPIEIVDIKQYQGDFVAIQTEEQTYIANGIVTHNCYIGPNEDAKKVYIVHQQNPDTKEYDEDKCMIGFNSLAEAKAAYLKQYDRPGFLQSITTMDLEEFRSKVLDPKNKGKMVKSNLNAEMQKSITQTIKEIINR